jgi:hypothetical protein
MSYKVLVIPEDHTYNGYILKPLAKKMLIACGKPNADIRVLENPRAAGYEHVKELISSQILDRYSHFDLLLFLPDRDGKDKSAEFKNLEEKAAGKGIKLLCCAAVEEVETWLLSGHLDKINKSWPEIRSDVSVKENIFDNFLFQYGDSSRAGSGRDLMMQETLHNYNGLINRCPELLDLQQRIRAIIPQD